MAAKGLKQAVEQAMAARRSTRHTGLWTYVAGHMDDIRGFLAEGATWAEIAAGFGAAGLLDRTGRPPSTPAVYQTFRRILIEAGESAVAPKRSALKAGRATAVGQPKKETPAKPATATAKDPGGPVVAVKMPSREWLD